MARRQTALEQIERRLELEAIGAGRRTRAQGRELALLEERVYRRLTRLDARILHTRQKLARLEAQASGREPV